MRNTARSVLDLLLDRDNREMMKQILSYSDLVFQGVRDGKEAAETLDMDSEEVSEIIWYGMGASGIIGEYIGTYLKYSVTRQDIDIFVARTYEKVHDDAFYVFYSYSGNTYEVLKALKEILEEKNTRRILTFSTGGMMLELAKKHDIPHIRLPEGFVSRSHFPYGLALATTILAKIFRIRNMVEDLKTTISTIGERILADSRDISNAKIINLLAKRISKKIVVIIADYKLKPVAKRFIAQLNENAKHFGAFFEVPEGCHNFIVGLRNMRKNCFGIILRRTSEDDILKLYMDSIERVINGMDSIKFTINDEEFCWKTLLEPTYLADILSVFLADVKGEKSFDIEEITILKRMISRGA